MDAPHPDLLRAFRAAVDARIARRPASLEVEALRAEVIARVAAGVARARAKGLLRRAWLFGSFVWGTPHRESDVDLMLEGADDPFIAAAEIEAGIGHEIDIVRFERAPAELRRTVLAEGKLL